MSDYWSLFYDGEALRMTTPDLAISKMMEARTQAEAANDQNAVLSISHWILQTIIFEQRDFKNAYDLVVKTAVEARKPQYSHLRERICVHQDLILTYEGIDPIGYADLIEDALNFMTQTITPTIQCRYCLQSLRCSFELEMERWDTAREAANHHLAMSEHGWKHHHGVAAHSYLTEIAYRQQAWETVITESKIGEELGRRNEHVIEEISFMMAARALAHRRLGQETEAQQAYRQAVAIPARTARMMRFVYYDALCDYHLAEGDIEAALKIRDRQLLYRQ
jgi:hypothetical protein